MFFFVQYTHSFDALFPLTGVPSVIVAVLDTGIATDHPDLKGNLWVNPGEVPGNGRDDDGNGEHTAIMLRYIQSQLDKRRITVNRKDFI
jgi:hypothetical protein